jgi:SAM-dependent methyltransferase
MLRRARAKAEHAGVQISLVQGDAGRLPLAMATFDVVLVRHLLWAFEDPDAVVAGWLGRLRSHGCLVLVEGRWSTGAGLLPSECVSVVLRHRQDATLHLLDDAALWGRPIEDQRFLIHSCR